MEISIIKDFLEMINMMDGERLIIIWGNLDKDYMMVMVSTLMRVFIIKDFFTEHSQVVKESASKEKIWLNSTQLKISMTS